MKYDLWKIRGVETALTVTTIDKSNPFNTDMTTLAAAFVAVDGTNGNKFVNTAGITFLWVKNTHATDDLEITIVTQYTQDGLALADNVITLDANDEILIGPFPAKSYNNGAGEVIVTWAESGGTGAVAASKVSPFKLVNS